MNVIGRLESAYRAFRAPEARPVKDAVKLRSMPTGALARAIRASNPRRHKPFARMPTDYRRYMPPDIEAALDRANGSGDLGGVAGAATIAAWCRSNPVVYGVTKGRTSIPWRPVGVKHSEEAAAWLEGTPTHRGWRERICDPAELEASHSDRFHVGCCVGINRWNDEKGHPEYQALDPAGLRYLRGEDRWQYHGWSKVFDLPRCPDGIWVFDGLVQDAPWREGAWYRIAYNNHDALNAMMLEALWMQVFAMPTVLAYHPQGASEDQKARFTQKAIGAALKVLGVTGGYKLEYAQAGAEGKDTFKQVTDRLRENVSILTWGTVGLIAGGAGFSNSDMFDQMKDDVIAEEARRQARMENEQIWQFVLDWGVRRGDLSRAARNAVIEYQTESPATIERKAKAAKALIDAGYSAEEAQRRARIEKAAMPGKVEDAGADVKQALNGAQIGSAVQIVTSVAMGQIPRPAGVAQLQILLNVEAAQAEEMMGTAGAGFIPTIEGQPVTPAAPALPAAPEAREEDPEEPGYSEALAARMSERGLDACPHGETRSCRSCRVVRRFEVQDGDSPFKPVWHAWTRRVA